MVIHSFFVLEDGRWEDKKESLCLINSLMIIVAVLIVVITIFGFCYFENRLASGASMGLFFAFFLWLNIFLIFLKLEQISLRDRMIDPILVRKLSNVIVLITITILIIIILLVVKALFVKLFFC